MNQHTSGYLFDIEQYWLHKGVLPLDSGVLPHVWGKTPYLKKIFFAKNIQYCHSKVKLNGIL